MIGQNIIIICRLLDSLEYLLKSTTVSFSTLWSGMQVAEEGRGAVNKGEDTRRVEVSEDGVLVVALSLWSRVLRLGK